MRAKSSKQRCPALFIITITAPKTLLSSTTSLPTLITGKLFDLQKSASRCFSYRVTYHVMKALNVIGHRGYKGFWKQTMMASTGFWK